MLFWQLEISNIMKPYPPTKALGHYSEAKRHQILLYPSTLPHAKRQPSVEKLSGHK